MSKASRRRFLAASAGLGAFTLSRGAWGRAGDPLSVAIEGPDVVVRHDGQTLCVYRHTASPRKPYIRELAPLGGENLLLDGPADHLHHHGLMYAIRVNGVNFWEETAGGGFQKPVGKPVAVVDRDPAGQPRATIAHDLHWVAEADAERSDTLSVALLIERRTLELGVDEANREVRIVWRSVFQAGPKAGELTLTGSNYNGLGVRFRRELDPVATHVIHGQPATLPPDTHVVTPSAWGAVRIAAPGRPATLAISSSPRNARAPGAVFSMTQPFVYLALTQSLETAPLVVAPGARFDLAYRITLTPTLETLAQLQARHVAWSSDVTPSR